MDVIFTQYWVGSLLTELTGQILYRIVGHPSHRSAAGVGFKSGIGRPSEERRIKSPNAVTLSVALVLYFFSCSTGLQKWGGPELPQQDSKHLKSFCMELLWAMFPKGCHNLACWTAHWLDSSGTYLNGSSVAACSLKNGLEPLGQVLDTYFVWQIC